MAVEDTRKRGPDAVVVPCPVNATFDAAEASVIVTPETARPEQVVRSSSRASCRHQAALSSSCLRILTNGVRWLGFRFSRVEQETIHEHIHLRTYVYSGCLVHMQLMYILRDILHHTIQGRYVCLHLRFPHRG